MRSDPWHVGQLSGDDGRTIRDENGLTVGVALDRAEARKIVEGHNGEADDDEPCRTCGAAPGTPEYGTVGDGFDGLCPSCADKAEDDSDV